MQLREGLVGKERLTGVGEKLEGWDNNQNILSDFFSHRIITLRVSHVGV